MKIALVDDDREQLQQLPAMIHRALQEYGIANEEISCFSGSEAFLTAWQPGGFDMIVLDIYMDEENGVELAQRIRQSDQNVALAFCTSSNEFATQSYEVNARYYLQKPVTQEKLSQMLRRMDLAQMEKRRSIQLPDGYRLLLHKLIYTNYVNHTVTFYIQGVQPHCIYITQAEVAQMLSDPFFFAVNKGSIVNFHMVKKIRSDGFLMQDGATVPIARRWYKEAKEAYMRFHFQKLSEEADD